MLRYNAGSQAYFIHARLSPTGNAGESLDYIQSIWEKAGFTGPVEYTFLNDIFRKYFETHRQTARTMGIFTSLSIFIACIGLFGLVAFIVEQRFKEIGIRKVLGATAKNILILLYKDFGKLLMIAAIISIPAIYVVGTQWLKNFAYHIDLTTLTFFIPVSIIIMLTVISTGARSLYAARMNPVKAIRD